MSFAPTEADPEKVGNVKYVGGAHWLGGAGLLASSAVVMLSTVMGTSSRFCTVKTDAPGRPWVERGCRA